MALKRRTKALFSGMRKIKKQGESFPFTRKEMAAGVRAKKKELGSKKLRAIIRGS